MDKRLSSSAVAAIVMSVTVPIVAAVALTMHLFVDGNTTVGLCGSVLAGAAAVWAGLFIGMRVVDRIERR